MDVSVIVPIHNAEAHLDECLASIAAQTAPSLEAILVDDGSTDGSLACARRFAERAPFLVTVVEQACRGVSAARNAGLDRAQGDYVLFVDADDLVEPRTAELALAKAREQDADMAIYGFWEYFGERGASVPRELCADERLYAAPFALRDVEGLMTEVVTPNVWRILYRRAFVEQHGLRFHERLRTAEDLAFIYESLLVADRIALLRERLYRYRRDGGTTLTRADRGTAGLDALGEVKRFAEARGGFDEAGSRQFANLVLDTAEYALWSAASARDLEVVLDAFQRDWAPFVGARDALVADRYRPFFEAARSAPALDYLFGLYRGQRARLEAADADREALRRELDAARAELARRADPEPSKPKGIFARAFRK